MKKNKVIPMFKIVGDVKQYKSNGFTLIELLAVIIILAIVALIATPIILDVIEDSRDSANLSEVNLILGGAETLFATATLTGEVIITDGRTNIYDKIQLSSGKPETGVVIMNEKGEVGVAFFLDNKCYKKEIFDDAVYIDESSKSIDECTVPVLPSELTDMAEFRSYSTTVSDSVKSLVFEINKNMSANEIESKYANNWDVSKYNDKSVMMFLDGDVLRVQAKGKILAPVDMSGYILNNSFYNTFGVKSTTQSIYLSALDTSQVTNMSKMFASIASLTVLDVSGFNTSNVIDMSSMFRNLSRVNSLNLSSFVTSNVTNMYGMFQNVSSVVSLDLSSFDTSNVTTMQYMFRATSDLTNIILDSFETSKVTDMRGMFQNTDNLLTLDLNNFDFSKIINNNIRGMLYESACAYAFNGGKIYVKSQADANYLYNYAAFNASYRLWSASFINPDTNEEYVPV